MIAAHQHHDGARRLLLPGCIELVRHQSQRLDLVLRRHSQEFRDVLNRLLSRSMHQQRLPILESRKIRHLVQFRCSLLQVSRVIASIAAHDPVFPGRCAHHEFMGLLASHRPRVRLHHHVLQPATVEDPAVSLVMLFVGNTQSRRIDVKGIRIFHHELPHPQQPRSRPRLIAKFRRNLIPDLRQLLVAPHLLQRDRRHHLFFGHAQAHVRALAVLQPEQVLAHQRPAPRSLPKLPRMQRRQIKLLPNPVHLLPDNPHDLVKRARAQKEVGVNPGRQLPDVSRANKKFMGRDLGIRRRLAQCRNKHL